MRASSRSRKILTTTASVAAARVVTVLCSFVAVPLCLSYLGVQAFGVWATVTSVVALMAFADLGIGNGVLNMLSGALGREDDKLIRRIVTTAFVILSSLGIVGFSIFLCLYRFVRWDEALGAAQVLPNATVASAVLILSVSIALNLPTSLMQRMQFALQMGHVNGVAQAGGGVLALLFIFLVTKTAWGLPGMVAATLVAPMMAIWASSIWMFLRSPEVLPSVRDFDNSEVVPILKSGSQFLFLGLVFCLCQTSDSLVIAKILGPGAVANFAVHQKYVSPIAFIGGMALTPLWAAYGEALARGDIDWIKRAFRKSLVMLTGAGVLLSILLLIGLYPLMTIWLKGRIAPDTVMAGSLLVWVSVEMIGKAISAFLHGVGMVGQQVWIAVVFLPLCLGTKVLFAYEFGAPGVVIGTVLAYVIVHAWPYWRLVRRWHCEHGANSVGAA